MAPPSKDLQDLRRLLEKEWDDDDRISVIVNAAPPPVPAKPSLMPGIPPKARTAIVLVLTALGALGAGAKVVWDLWK